jgi:NtrC-family two-component system response regulator AlgB
MAKLLVVDDGNREVWKRLRARLESRGHEVERVTSGSPALKLLARNGFDVVFSNRRIAEGSDYKFLREVRRIKPNASIVLTTEVDAIHQASNGLFASDCKYIDYVTKLWPIDKLEQLIEVAIGLQRMRSKTRVLPDATADCLFLPSRSSSMRRLLESAQQAAASPGTVLLIGENGTGKTLLAQQMHLWSPRRAKAFVIINCSSLSPYGLEREILGRAAMSGPIRSKRARNQIERAEGGTVFIEEVSDLPGALQVALVRFAQDRTLETAEGEKVIDVRIIAATSSDLRADVSARRFREDLFYSLNIISLQVPALRERSADIIPLAKVLLAAAAVRNNRSHLRISDAAARTLTSYRWPGNVRELRNAMEAAAVLCDTDTITLARLPGAVSNSVNEIRAPQTSRTRLDEIEREHIAHVLADSRTLEEAAMTLGIDVSTLWRKRKRYKLDPITDSKV